MINSSCIPLFTKKEITLKGVVRNYITHEEMANISIHAFRSNGFSFIRICPNLSEYSTTDSSGKFLMDFEHYCGFELILDLSNQKHYNKLSQHQLIINDVPSNSDRPFVDMSELEMLVEVQPYIYLNLLPKEKDSLSLDHIYIPEFDIRIDSFKNSESHNLYLRQFTGKFDIYIIYQNKQVKKTIDYDYFDKKYIGLEIEI